MASGTKLQLGFNTAEGKTKTVSYNYTKQSLTAGTVKNLMEKMIANTSIYEDTLISPRTAKTIVTTEIVYDLSDTADLSHTGYLFEEAVKKGIIDEEGEPLPQDPASASQNADAKRETTTYRIVRA